MAGFWNGIDGYDLLSPKDRAFAFDYDGSGLQDHLVFYRPGDGICYIMVEGWSQFEAVFTTHSGIGGYDLKDANDSAFAFDYDGSGKLDHLVFYRPGHGVCYILRNAGGQFQQVFATQTGIGGYDLQDASDRAFAFDYNGSGKLDHLVFYRPGHGVCYILRNAGGQFQQVFATQTGIGGYDLLSPTDQALAFDYTSSGRLDHLVLFRQTVPTFWVLENQGGAFTPVYAGENFHANFAPQVCVLDGFKSGRLDCFTFYSPGEGVAAVVKNDGSDRYRSEWLVRVPDVMNEDLPQAIQNITVSQLRVGAINGPSTPDSTVTDQDPAGGAIAGLDEPVNLTTAVLATTVPMVIGLSSAEARSILAQSHLAIGPVTGPQDPGSRVIQQVPLPGTAARYSQQVNLTMADITRDMSEFYVEPPSRPWQPGDATQALPDTSSRPPFLNVSQGIRPADTSILDGEAISAAWFAACPHGPQSPNSCCACHQRYPNNCAHFLSNAFMAVGYTLTGYPCNAARPVRARQVRDWFAAQAIIYRDYKPANDPDAVWWAVFQVDEQAYWGGHVALYNSVNNTYIGTGFFEDWTQACYTW